MNRDPLLHPAFLAALAVLWLNDHVWKAAHPGLLTGKLSDVAGLFMLPVVIGAVARRLGIGSPRPVHALTLVGALWFSLANLWSPAQVAFEQIFGLLRWLPSVASAAAFDHPRPPFHAVTLTADPSDLIALPVILLGLALDRRSALPALSRKRPVPPASCSAHL